MEEMEKTQQHDYRWQGEERRKQQGDYSGEERRKSAANDQETEQEPDQSAQPQDQDPEATQH